MKSGYADRIPHGDRSELQAMEILSRNKVKVERANLRTGDWDLMANGKKIDVKAAVYTSYKGSDGNMISGYVFSNMHKEPKCDYYMFMCMSDDRETVQGYYLVPCENHKQRTLTLTRRMAEKLAPYKGNLSPLKDKK